MPDLHRRGVLSFLGAGLAARAAWQRLAPPVAAPLFQGEIGIYNGVIIREVDDLLFIAQVHDPDLMPGSPAIFRAMTRKEFEELYPPRLPRLQFEAIRDA
jgi:Protein of unknown function (DUF4043)